MRGMSKTPEQLVQQQTSRVLYATDPEVVDTARHAVAAAGRHAFDRTIDWLVTHGYEVRLTARPQMPDLADARRVR